MKLKIKSSILAASVIAATSTLAPSLSQAAVALDDAGKVKLFGDMRFRAEQDRRTRDSDAKQNRTRLRYRARLGASFKATDVWSGRIRIATGENLNSPHISFNQGQLKMTIDNAYITYKPTDSFYINMGRSPLKFWATSEIWWDTDNNPDSLTAIYKAGGFTLGTAYSVVETDDFSSSATSVSFYQAAFESQGSGLKLKGSLGGANMNEGGNVSYQGNTFTIASGMIKGSNWRLAADMVSSDADTEDQAYSLQGRYKITKTIGLRAYFYHVEAFSVLGDGDYSQDNWFTQGSRGISNFDGYRLQLDYKAAKNVGIDLRWYDGQRLKDPATLAAPTSSTSILNDKERTRLQLNVNVKF